jgi:hypothetical protein
MRQGSRAEPTGHAAAGRTRRALGRGAAGVVAGGGLASLPGLLGGCALPGGPAPAATRGGGEVRFLHWIPDWA